MSDTQVIVVGADYHGEWAKDVTLAFRAVGMGAELVYTNTLFGGLNSASSVKGRAFLETIKEFFRQHARFFFDFIKGVRRQMAERSLLKKIASFHKPGEKLLVLFIWTPPGETILKYLKKRGGITLMMWEGEIPLGHPGWIPSFPYFDHIFSVDEEWIPLFEKEVQGRTTYLPLSSSPTKYFPLKNEGKDGRFASDIAFVGYYRPERAETLSVLKDRDIKIYGYWWETGMEAFPWLKEKYGGPLSNEDANQAFNEGKIQIGRLHSPVPYGNTITQRVFDIALAGNFQLSGYSAAIEKIFGKSVVMFHNGEELKKLVDYYLAHPEERQRLAGEAHAIALKDHAYASRIKTIIETLQKMQ